MNEAISSPADNPPNASVQPVPSVQVLPSPSPSPSPPEEGSANLPDPVCPSNPADLMLGRKLPAHSLWVRLRERKLTLEFCSQFFNDQMSYAEAREWLAECGIPVSLHSLSGFRNSLDMQMRFAALQEAQLDKTAKIDLPADLAQATRQRIAQHKFILASMNLGSKQRLQLIKLQQKEDALQGHLALGKARQKTYARWIALEEKKAAPAMNQMTPQEVEELNDKNRARVLAAVDEVLGITTPKHATPEPPTPPPNPS